MGEKCEGEMSMVTHAWRNVCASFIFVYGFVINLDSCWCTSLVDLPRDWPFSSSDAERPFGSSGAPSSSLALL